MTGRLEFRDLKKSLEGRVQDISLSGRVILPELAVVPDNAHNATSASRISFLPSWKTTVLAMVGGAAIGSAWYFNLVPTFFNAADYFNLGKLKYMHSRLKFIHICGLCFTLRHLRISLLQPLSGYGRMSVA